MKEEAIWNKRRGMEDTSKLIEEIRKVLVQFYIERGYSLESRRGEVAYAKSELHTELQRNPFYIAYHEDKVIQISNQEKLNDILETIRDLKEIEEFVEEYQYTEDKQRKIYIKLLNKLIVGIYEKMRLEYANEENNADRLAKLIYKYILDRHISRLYEAVYSIIIADKGDDFLNKMVHIVNQYLEKIGIYSWIAKEGEPYDDEILYCYRGILNNNEKKNEPLRVLSVQVPAYFISYLDDDEIARYCKEGKCICE